MGLGFGTRGADMCWTVNRLLIGSRIFSLSKTSSGVKLDVTMILLGLSET